MKIVHVVCSLDMGGAEIIVAQLCRLHRSQGHDLRVLVHTHLGVIGEALRAEGFQIHELGGQRALPTIRQTYRLFREWKPDVVHCHNVSPTVQATASARFAGVPSVISTRHRVELHPYSPRAEGLFNIMGWFCNWITGICEVTCDNVRRGPFARKSKIINVYNGTEPVRRASFDHLGKRGFTLLYVGRLVREKDLGTLIRAVALARESVPDLEAWIVGPGREREALEALAEELGVSGCVRFFGLQTETAPFFSAADTFVMSSISEGLPMSLLQSMSLGTPAILTDVDGNGEVLRLTQHGLLVPMGDPEAFAAAIETMAGDASLRATFSRRALDQYDQRFKLERMSDAYLNLYRSSQPKK